MLLGVYDPDVGGFVRPLEDGRQLQLVVQLCNVRLSVGEVGDSGWDDSW